MPADIFGKTEDERLQSFDSRTSHPLLVFLGMDESHTQDGLSYKVYKGTPYFALDVTPRGPLEQDAKGIVEAMEAQGLSFHQTRVMTAVSADQGVYMDSPPPPPHNDLVAA